MPRAKRGNRRGALAGADALPHRGAGNSGQPRRGRHGLRGAQAARQDFSMADEARNTDHRHSWEALTRLRDTGVQFVSAGLTHNEFSPRLGSSRPVSEEDHPDSNGASPIPEDYIEPVALPQSLGCTKPPAVENQPQTQSGGEATVSVATTHGIDSPIYLQEEGSDSSSEVIIFSGRNKGKSPCPTDGDPNVSLNTSSYGARHMLVTRTRSPQRGRAAEAADAHEPQRGSQPSRQDQRDRKARRNGKPPAQSHHQNTPSDDALDDYIKNVQQFEDGSTGRDSPQSNPGVSGELQYRTGRGRLSSPVDYRCRNSTNQTGMANINELFPSEEDSSIDGSSIASLDTAGQAARDLQEAINDVALDEQLFQSRVSGMTDEELALRLSKQDALGMDSDALLLLDGAESEANDREEDMDYLRLELGRFKRRVDRKSSDRQKSIDHNSIQSTMLDDTAEYPNGGFDIMDRSRHSIQSRSSIRATEYKGTLVDDDIQEILHRSWRNDRMKKKERKLLREEMRSQGALGKSGKTDMKAKYKEGMNFDQAKVEIRAFMEGEAASVSLPPMDKNCRKMVHELSSAFNLKSKSAGSGKKRYPCLFRTSRTLPFDESVFRTVEARIGRRYLPRTWTGMQRQRIQTGGGGGSTAAAYQDGDVVGASAPELGLENRGRAMLERMGWSTGTPLGALNNKGMLQPVVHVVKKSRAGLG